MPGDVLERAGDPHVLPTENENDGTSSWPALPLSTTHRSQNSPTILVSHRTFTIPGKGLVLMPKTSTRVVISLKAGRHRTSLPVTKSIWTSLASHPCGTNYLIPPLVATML